MPKVPMIFVRIGSVILIFTAFLYLNLGYPYVSKGLFAANLDAGLSGDLKAVWVGFCLHLFFIAYLLMFSSRRSNPHPSIMVLSGLVVIVDSLLVRVFFANTMGAQLLMVSGLAVLLGSFLSFQFRSGHQVPAPNN